MARDNGYDDLLSMFDKETDKKAGENTPLKKETEKKPSAPPVKEVKSSMAQRFNREMEDISSNSTPENNGKKIVCTVWAYDFNLYFIFYIK